MCRHRQTPETFVAAPNGEWDWGEITPDMGYVMHRQAGKIRLRRAIVCTHFSQGQSGINPRRQNAQTTKPSHQRQFGMGCVDCGALGRMEKGYVSEHPLAPITMLRGLKAIDNIRYRWRVAKMV